MTVTASSAAPISRSASSAPKSRPSATSGWKRARTTAIRSPRASGTDGAGATRRVKGAGPAASLALELRPPLLEEGLGALLHLPGRADEAEERGLPALGLVQGHLQAVVHRR